MPLVSAPVGSTRARLGNDGNPQKNATSQGRTLFILKSDNFDPIGRLRSGPN
jgi:hypothetical protein